MKTGTMGRPAVLVCVLSAGLAAAGSAQTDIAVKFRGLMPERDEDWSSASGAELQVRFWGNESVGAALAVGLESWNAEREYSEEQDEHGYLATLIDGSMTAIPVGASALCRAPIGKRASIVLEGGLRYVFIDSGITVEAEVADAHGSTYTRDTIESDDGLVGVLGISLEATLVDTLFLFGGVGYQFDLVKPEERFLGESLGETSLQAVAFSAGVGWSF